MFSKLLRSVYERSSEARVGFLSEPTAIAVDTSVERPARRVSLEEWAKLDAHDAAPAAAQVSRREDGGGEAIVVGGNAEILVVQLEGSDQVSEFLNRLLGDDRRVRMVITPNDPTSTGKEQPPKPTPPKPTPGAPIQIVAGRLEALRRIGGLVAIDVNFPDKLLERAAHER